MASLRIRGAASTILLLLGLPVALAVCEDERKVWNSWMSTTSMAEYIAEPELFWKSLWKPSALLATCMNAYFNTTPSLKTHLVNAIPNPDDEEQYIDGQPLPLNPRWSYYQAHVTGLHADQTVQHEHSALLAQSPGEVSTGVCCLVDFSFVLKAPVAKGSFANHTQRDPRPMVDEDSKTVYYCRKGNMVRNFAGYVEGVPGMYRVPIVDMGRFPKNFVDGQKVDMPDYSYMFDYDALHSDQVSYLDDDEMIKEDVEFAGNMFQKGSATLLTQELFVKKANSGKERVAPCRQDGNASLFYGVLAIEPAERGKPGHSSSVPPIAMPQKSMLHAEAHDRVIFARVKNPKVYLVAVRFSCPKTDVTLEDFEFCTFPDMWPIKEVTHVSGVGLRPYQARWKSVKGLPIIFHKDMGMDIELIILFSLLAFMMWSFSIAIKCKNRFLSKFKEEHIA